MFKTTILFLMLCCIAFKAHSHGGRTNSQGCHNQTSNGSYHCHNGGSSSKARSSSNGYFENCSAARAAGVAPIRKGEKGYRSALDRGGDGVACE